MHHRGLGMKLVRSLIDIARKEGLSQLTADTLIDHRDMQPIFEKLDSS